MRDPNNAAQRRTVLAGAGAVGALAAAATVLHGTPQPAPAAAATDKPAPEGAAGYRLTDHVKRYYATTRI